MERRELIRSMEKYTGCGFITRNQVAGFMGKKDPHSIDKYIHGLPKVGQSYFIPDVATSLQEAVR